MCEHGRAVVSTHMRPSAAILGVYAVAAHVVGVSLPYIALGLAGVSLVLGLATIIWLWRLSRTVRTELRTQTAEIVKTRVAAEALVSPSDAG